MSFAGLWLRPLGLLPPFTRVTSTSYFIQLLNSFCLSIYKKRVFVSLSMQRTAMHYFPHRDIVKLSCSSNEYRKVHHSTVCCAYLFIFNIFNCPSRYSASHNAIIYMGFKHVSQLQTFMHDFFLLTVKFQRKGFITRKLLTAFSTSENN